MDLKMLEYKTRIIKLLNGEDLIANVSLNDTGNYTLDEPMSFYIDARNPNNAGLIMKHWLPVQLLKKNSIEIQSKDILSFLDPEDEFRDYYVDTIQKVKDLLKARELMSEMDDIELNDLINQFEELEHHGNTLH